MTYVPQIESSDSWVRHFKEMSEQKHKPTKFFVLMGNQRGSGQTVSLVTPMAQSVQRAKAEVKQSIESAPTKIKLIKGRKGVSKKVIKRTKSTTQKGKAKKPIKRTKPTPKKKKNTQSKVKKDIFS